MSTLSSWEAWQLWWDSKVVAYTKLGWSDGLHVDWSLGRLIHYSLHFGVRAWLLFGQGAIWLMALDKEQLQFVLVSAKGVEMERILSGDWVYMEEHELHLFISLYFE